MRSRLFYFIITSLFVLLPKKSAGREFCGMRAPLHIESSEQQGVFLPNGRAFVARCGKWTADWDGSAFHIRMCHCLQDIEAPATCDTLKVDCSSAYRLDFAPDSCEGNAVSGSVTAFFTRWESDESADEYLQEFLPRQSHQAWEAVISFSSNGEMIKFNIINYPVSIDAMRFSDERTSDGWELACGTNKIATPALLTVTPQRQTSNPNLTTSDTQGLYVSAGSHPGPQQRINNTGGPVVPGGATVISFESPAKLAEGQRLMKEGHWVEARTALEASLAADPGNDVALFELGLANAVVGKYDVANELWRKARMLSDDPTLIKSCTANIIRAQNQIKKNTDR